MFEKPIPSIEIDVVEQALPAVIENIENEQNEPSFSRGESLNEVDVVEQALPAAIENIENEQDEPSNSHGESLNEFRASPCDAGVEHARSNQNLDHIQNITVSIDEFLAPSLSQQNESTANNNDEVSSDNEEEVDFNLLANNGAEYIASGNELDPLHIDIDVKPEPLDLFDLHNDRISFVLNDSEPENNVNEKAEKESADKSDADVILVPHENDFPMPQKYDVFALMKRENDEVSGNIPYDEKVCNSCSTHWLDIRFVRMNSLIWISGW